jgi:hypothetical protein
MALVDDDVRAVPAVLSPPTSSVLDGLVFRIAQQTAGATA